jgi:hypothetical protein
VRRIAEEAEVIARLDYVTGQTNITVVSWPAMARRMERLYGKPADSRGQVRRWKVKGLLLVFRRSRKHAVLAPPGPLKRVYRSNLSELRGRDPCRP